MRAGAKWEGLGFLLIVAGMIIDMAGAGGFGWACLDSRIKCNMIEIIRRCSVSYTHLTLPTKA